MAASERFGPRFYPVAYGVVLLYRVHTTMSKIKVFAYILIIPPGVDFIADAVDAPVASCPGITDSP